MLRGKSHEQQLPKKHVPFFIFGDSFLDAGNNYINTSTLDQANFWPYGLTYFNFPTGSNDYMSPFLTNSTFLHHHSTYVGMEIYRGGGRKFAFINLPDLGCLPGMRIIKLGNNGSCLEEATRLAQH
ncbi:hypothetical protein V6N13_144141 [Hibiscus sabdariffa]|uniref:GDSL esterase/lipase n=1 Tax=Hibiscus sabdariffa TaxID=183260 RepID=A0ABR2FJS9_9ROSI